MRLHTISKLVRFGATSSALALALGGTAFAQDVDPQAEDAAADSGNTIIVTAQRTSQSLQEVPIAVSAFSAEALEKQQIENASDLQLTLPNVTFTKGNFTGSSFTIRGIGDLCVGISCDSATAIHLNGSPLFGTRLFETEYFDLERIEVLRGPQGTLFGRNATSGVVNIVTAKPRMGEFAASVEGEYANYDSIKGKAWVNVPLGDTMAIRLAGFYLNRDGYTKNLFNGDRYDDRDMYAVRGSFRWEPGPDTTFDLLGYYFREDDSRLRIQKQQCQYDPTGVLGCLAARRDTSKNNTNATFTGTLGSREFLAINLAAFAPLGSALGLNSLYDGGAFLNFQEPRDPRVVNTSFVPEYFTDEIQAQARIEHDFGSIKAQLTGLYQETEIFSRQDYNLGVASRNFNSALATLTALGAGGIPGIPGSAAYFAPLVAAIVPNGPTGAICTSDTNPDGLGAFGGNKICSQVPQAFDRSSGTSESYSGELILSTDFDGPINFLLGGIYAESKARDGDYYVNAFAIDYVTGLLGSFTSLGTLFTPAPDQPPSFLGTPFFRNNTDFFKLKSYGIFGEAYWNITDTLKFTGGLRYNNDKKFLRARSTLASFLVPYAQTGDAFNAPAAAFFDADLDADFPGVQAFQIRDFSFDEVTGRAVLDWQMTPDNLLYASYSRGYKSGGINPPVQAVGVAVPDAFAPEIVDAFELGSKNVFANGDLILNLTAFYYKYKGLQLSRIVARTSVNDNINADIYGLEAEAVVRPGPNTVINIGASYLNTEVKDDTLFVNQRDPSGGNPNAVIIKDITAAFNCAVVANTGGPATAEAFVTNVNNIINGSAGLTPANGLRAPQLFPADSGLGARSGAFSICSTLNALSANPALNPGGAVTVFPEGVAVSIDGNKLPQAPNYKFSVGVQHTIEFGNDMTLVPRADLIYTGEQFGNIFNGNVNKIEGYEQVNAQIQLNGRDDRWFVRGFVQNLFDVNPVTGLYLTDQSSGLFTNIFTLEPRRYGIAAGFKF